MNNKEKLHISETMIDYFPSDIMLTNSGDITDLYNLLEHEIHYSNKLKL